MKSILIYVTLLFRVENADTVNRNPVCALRSSTAIDYGKYNVLFREIGIRTWRLLI